MAAAAADLPGGGADHAILVRGAPRGHAGNPAHGAGAAPAAGARQVRGNARAGGAGAGTHPAAADHGGAARAARLGSSGRRLSRHPVPGRGLCRHRPLHERPHRQPHRRADPDRAGVRALLSGGIEHPDQSVRPPHRRRAGPARHRHPLRIHHPRRAGSARSLLLRRYRRGIPDPEPVRPRTPALGRQSAQRPPPALGPGCGTGGGQLRGGQPVAGSHRLGARRHHPRQALFAVGGDPGATRPGAGATADSWLFLRQDPPPARASGAADQESAGGVRSGRRQPCAGGVHRPSHRSRAGG